MNHTARYDYEPDETDDLCPLECGCQLFKRHCKEVCPEHGVISDCSDPPFGTTD